MSIYSNNPKPYVYICTHTVTGEFYIGYREQNVKLGLLPSEDLPTYRSSSRKVNPIFDEFVWEIVSEFDTGEEAYEFEQKLIYENWSNALLLNESCFYGKRAFKRTGSHTDDTKRKIGEANKIKLTGIKRSNEFKAKIGRANKGKVVSQKTRDKLSKIVSEEHRKNPRIWSEESKKKLSATNKGKKLSEEHKAKISEAKRKRDKERPISEETKKKISETLKGRPSPLKGRRRN
jgi:hypothetical protein